MSGQGEQKTESPIDNGACERKMDLPQTTDNRESSSGSQMESTKSESKDDKDSRYGKTFQVFQQMGLLDYALQMAKLSKDNEQLQQKINKLEMEVNEGSRKAGQALKDKLEQVSQTTS